MKKINDGATIKIIGDESKDNIESLLQEREKLIKQGKNVILCVKRPVYEYDAKRPDDYALKMLAEPEIIDIYDTYSIDDIYDILFASSKEDYDHKPRIYLKSRRVENIISAISSMQRKLGENFRIVIDNNRSSSPKGFDASKVLTIDELAKACFNRPLNKCTFDQIDTNNPIVTDLIFKTFKEYTYPELFPLIVHYTAPMRYMNKVEQLGDFIISLKNLGNVKNFEEEAKKYSDPDKNLFELSVLMQFAKNGPEFYEYVVGRIKPEQLQQEALQSTLKKIKERNQEFEKSYITPKSALKNALNTTSMEKVEEARAQEMTQENAREEEKENG